MKVDLTLAVNYLPACACLCKVLGLMLALSLIAPGDEVRSGYIPLAAVLYLDRLLTRNLIFDANSILMAIYFSNAHAVVRATSQRNVHFLITAIPHILWIGGCLTLLVEPAPVRQLMERRKSIGKITPVIAMLMIIVGTAGIFSPLETSPVRACRALAFTLLSFVWIYMVGIHSPQGIEFLKENSYQFIMRLAPILYSPLWAAIPFPMITAAVLIWQYTQRQAADVSNETPLQSVEVSNQADNTEEAAFKELLRQAKLGRGETGPE
jgi:hypothetical protein